MEILGLFAIVAFLFFVVRETTGSRRPPQRHAPASATPPPPRASPQRPPPPQIELTDEIRAALELIERQRRSLFITGKAGTGKSTLLRYVRDTTQHAAVVLAPTGLAAINVGGQTIHSFFRFPPRFIDDSVVRPSRSAALLKRLETIIVDEVSMVRADLLDGMDKSLRLNRGKPNVPFGGVQLVMFGDLFQLPPIVRERELKEFFDDHYGGPYFFLAKALQSGRWSSLELTKIYRQTDPQFVELLNRIREKDLDGGVLAALNRRVRRLDDLPSSDHYTVLTTTNQAAFEMNITRLAQLPTPEHSFDAIVNGRFDSSSYPTESELRLKVGARVMMIKNDLLKRWVNGTLATICALDDSHVWVEIGGTRSEVTREKWENIEYCYDRSKNAIEQRVVGVLQQFPLRLAWAITIHKSQGLTFDRIYLDLGRGAFAHGQTYVALSRCRTLEGIGLSRPVQHTDVIFDDSVYGFANVFRPVSSGASNG